MTKQKEYIPIYFDALFYKVFGEEKRIDALKYIIEQILNVKVKSIRILNGKILGNKFRTKRSYLDLLVILNDDTKLSIEVNTDTSKHIMERNILFIFKVMANDTKIGNDYKDLSNFIQINLNSENSNNVYDFEKYVLMEEKSHKILTDKLQILKINLSFYTNKCYTSSELNKLSDFEKLMGLIGARTKEEYNLFSSEEGMLKEIMDTADEFRDDSGIIEMYDKETEMNRIFELEKRDAIKEAIDERDRIKELEKQDAIKEAIDERDRIKELEKQDAIKEAIDERDRIKELEKQDAIKEAIDERDRIKELEKQDAIKEAIDERDRIKELEKQDAIKEAIEERDRIKELEIQDAIKESSKENSKAIALNFIKKGIDLDIISDATGLSMDEVIKLKNIVE